MSIAAVLLMTAIAAADSAPAPPPPKSGIRVIEIDPAKPGEQYYVKASPSTKTVFQFPEAWATTPICGDCIIGDEQPVSQLWRLDLIPETNSVVLNAIRRPSATLSPLAFKTNLDVTLKSGLSIVVRIEIVLPDEADTRVQFTMPKSSTADAILSKERARLEQEFSARAKDVAMRRILDIHMRKTVCKDFAGRPNRNEMIVVRLKQFCRTSNILYLTFEVENRSGEDLQLATASLADKANTSTYAQFETTRLAFNDRTLGIAALELPGGDPPPSTYTLTVQEDGGKDRDVVVDGIDF